MEGEKWKGGEDIGREESRGEEIRREREKNGGNEQRAKQRWRERQESRMVERSGKQNRREGSRRDKNRGREQNCGV